MGRWGVEACWGGCLGGVRGRGRGSKGCRVFGVCPPGAGEGAVSKGGRWVGEGHGMGDGVRVGITCLGVLEGGLGRGGYGVVLLLGAWRRGLRYTEVVSGHGFGYA